VEFAKKRFNCMVSVKLAARQVGYAPLVVSTYHMPCAYFLPPVMNIHTALCARRALGFAKGEALVLCGDFNVKPGDAPYNILVQGHLSAEDLSAHQAACAEAGAPDTWEPSLADLTGSGLRSAYAEHRGCEPDFTNYCQTVKDTSPFIETLDYILVHSGLAEQSRVEVTDTSELPHRDDVTDGPYPNEKELSDHAMLSATLRVR